MKNSLKMAMVAAGLAASSLAAPVAQAADVCSVWLVENSRFMGVPFGAFMPDRAFVPGSTNKSNNINTVDLADNVGVIKCVNELILNNNVCSQTDYHKMTGTDHSAPLPKQIAQVSFDAKGVD